MSRNIDSRFLIRPLDAIYFGRPRPFSAGENHRGESEFPPSGYAFQGMVRSQLLRATSVDLNSRATKDECAALVGGPDALPKGWQLAGPLPAREVRPGEGEEDYLQPWAPAPLFLLGEHDRPCRALPLPQNSHPAMNDLAPGTLLLGRPDLGQTKPLAGWLAPANLHHALTGAGAWNPQGHCRDLPPFVHHEPRPGLALDGDTARHRMLYFLDTLRFHDPDGGAAGLYGRLKGRWDPRIPDHALTATLGAAGRKQRPAAFTTAPALDPQFDGLLRGEHLPESVGEDDRFWLVTLTPVALAEPMRPVQLAGEVRFQALGMLSGPPLTFGGYRFADQKTRPNRAYLPAGTCWLFRLEGGNPERRAEALRRLNDAHLLGDPAEAGFGFGHTLVGIGPQPEEE